MEIKPKAIFWGWRFEYTYPAMMNEQGTEIGVGKPQQARKQSVLPLVFVLVGVALVLISAGAILLGRSSGSTEAGVSVAPRVGQRLADFALTDLDGQTVRLSDFAGRPVLINAWATWCPPCRAEMPDLNAYYRANRERGFVILAVNAGESRELAAGFVDEMGLEFPVLLDSDYALMDRLLIDNYPTSILVGADGLVKTIHIGLFRPEQMEKEITPYIR